MRPRLNTTNQAFGPPLGSDPTSDDTSGVSSAPIDALLFEARCNPVVSPCGTSLTVRPVAAGAVESASSRFLQTSVDIDRKSALYRPRVGGSHDWQLPPRPHDGFLGFMPLLVRPGTSSAERRCACHHKFEDPGLTMLYRQTFRKKRRAVLLREHRSRATPPQCWMTCKILAILIR